MVSKASTSPPPAPPSVAALVERRSGNRPIVALGREKRASSDLYVRAMEMSWPRLFLVFSAIFISFNLVFAFLYWLQPGCLGDASAGGAAQSYLDAFFFSVQTVATIGYGVLFPKTLYANVLVTMEIMAGVLGITMGTGLMFARFSRPTARIMFSKIAVIGLHNGVPTLMFRAANQRHNLILEAHVQVAVTRFETSAEGRVMRRFRDLPVERSDNLTFILSWTVLHPINESSPLSGMTADDFANSDLEIVIVMSGTDENFSQAVHARHVYAARDILWGHHFVDIIGLREDGVRTIDYAKFHRAEPAPL